ncbi:MAG: 16S rRNA (cytosine(1402)-N(4))-methyltransferase RsmH [Bacteroidales bacterium]|nr:16S rRNA (cytosine(1402)-N(4))-methyltransferase RsmH [Bacteroidales bacterium]
MSEYHIPVMLNECLEGLQIRPDGTYVDVTFGGGGHSRAILERLGPNGHLYSFDQDPDAERNIAGAEGDVTTEGRFTFVRSNFRYLRNWMRYYGVEHIDGLLADLGVSSHHLDEASRGFAFRLDAPLDMRMNTRAGMTAAQLLAEASEEQLARILTLYGELRQAKRMAAALVRARQKQTIATTGDLQQILLPMIDPRAQKKELAQAFQALRIEVNHEMAALEEMLNGAVQCLAPGGRLVVMTYHSLEDRIVKNVIRSGHADGKIEQDFYGRILAPLKAVNNKPIMATEAEQEQNPRSRSAKLRIAAKLPTDKNEKQ